VLRSHGWSWFSRVNYRAAVYRRSGARVIVAAIGDEQSSAGPHEFPSRRAYLAPSLRASGSPRSINDPAISLLRGRAAISMRFIAESRAPHASPARSRISMAARSRGIAQQLRGCRARECYYEGKLFPRDVDAY